MTGPIVTLRWTVRLLHVAPIPEARVADHGRVIAYESQERERLKSCGLEDLRMTGAELEGVPVESVVRFGNPVEEIVSEAEAFGADLIALATPRRSWLRRVLGSAADKVFRTAGVPVLLEVAGGEPARQDHVPGAGRRGFGNAPVRAGR